MVRRAASCVEGSQLKFIKRSTLRKITFVSEIIVHVQPGFVICGINFNLTVIPDIQLNGIPGLHLTARTNIKLPVATHTKLKASDTRKHKAAGRCNDNAESETQNNFVRMLPRQCTLTHDGPNRFFNPNQRGIDKRIHANAQATGRDTETATCYRPTSR